MTAQSPKPEPGPPGYVTSASGLAGEFERQLARISSSPATVLLVGESGAGKSAAARRLHAAGERALGPLVEVSLAALAPTLIESELFGHEQGAFTGATKTRVGRFLRASGGTLVLDGVESLSEELQVKLLRVLQEQVVEPLGGAPQAIDVRVIATSTRDLRVESEAGRFRQDLYFRLAVITLQVPPLRSRLVDLPAFVEEFNQRAAARLKVAPRSFGQAALTVFESHGWPGNLRELENAIERVLVLAPPSAGEVGAEELEFLRAEIDGEARELARRALALGLSLDDLGRAMIAEAVSEQRGNLSAAARQLGLSRRALEYRRNQESKGAAD